MTAMETQDSVVSLLPRPELGLALAGGAARGLFHLGVMHALREAGIQPDWYAGTSAGSIVATCMAAGLSVERIREFVGGLSWRKNVLGVRRSAWDMMSTIGSYVSGRFERMPPGFFENSRMAETIEALIGKRCFSEMAPLILTATDVLTGEEVLLTSPAVAHHLAERGCPRPRPERETDWERMYAPHLVVMPTEDVPLAVRCSTCIPGVMTTVKAHGRLLNDGGIVDLVPVRPLRAAGCRKVLAVFLGLLPRSTDARHWAGVGANSVNYLASEQLTASLREADYVIYDPAIESVSLVSLDPKLIDIGYEFTRARISEIRSALGLDLISVAA